MAEARGLPVCGRGHDLTKPGALNGRGMCKECVKVASKERRERIRSGDFSRMRKPICKHGHDKRVVGISPNGGCAECNRTRTKRREATKPWVLDPATVDFRNPFCPRGHDKRVVGVNKQYACMECMRETSKAFSLSRRRREGGFDGEPQKIPNLKNIRQAAGLTQERMAARIGVTRPMYSRLENGRQAASRKTLAKVVRAVAELNERGAGRAGGRFGRLLRALSEAERRGEPTPRAAAGIAGENPRAMAGLLRELAGRGLAERFENERGVAWLLTEEGRRRVGNAA